eukprot:2732262-Amphidinium_carterae.1
MLGEVVVYLQCVQDGLEQLTSKQKVMDDGAQAKLHVQATACKELQEEPSSQGGLSNKETVAHKWRSTPVARVPNWNR